MKFEFEATPAEAIEITVVLAMAATTYSKWGVTAKVLAQSTMLTRVEREIFKQIPDDMEEGKT